MNTKLGRAVILVEDYDKALDFYQKNFQCKLLYDSQTPDGQRLIHIAFSDDDDKGICLLKADPSELPVGKQTGGAPTLVIFTDAIEQLYSYVKKNGVKIAEPLVSAKDNKLFHCLDLYGNRLTVVQRK
jgi:predicted enzyme related to lactoylglutathione lyase